MWRGEVKNIRGIYDDSRSIGNKSCSSDAC